MPRIDSAGIRLLRGVVAPLAAYLLRVLSRSWRIETCGPDPFAPGAPRPLIGALWHQSALVAAGIYRDRDVHVAVSRSRDGGHIDAVLLRLGFGDSPRGSSSRGGTSALRSSMRHLESGGIVALLVDGPRGPARVAKSGAISAARLSGAPVLPVAMSARPSFRFGSWDRMHLPGPFARVRIHYGQPVRIASDASDEEIETQRALLEARLDALTDAADAAVAGPARAPARS